MRFLSNFVCKIIFMCSVNFWHQQDYNSLFKVSIGHVTSYCKRPTVRSSLGSHPERKAWLKSSLWLTVIVPLLSTFHWWKAQSRNVWTFTLILALLETFLTFIFYRLVRLVSYLNYSNKDCDWLILACFIRAQSTADDTFTPLEIMYVLKIQPNA